MGSVDVPGGKGGAGLLQKLPNLRAGLLFLIVELPRDAVEAAIRIADAVVGLLAQIGRLTGWSGKAAGGADQRTGGLAAAWAFWSVSAGFGLCFGFGLGAGAGGGVFVAAGCGGAGTVMTGGGRLAGALSGLEGGVSSMGGASAGWFCAGFCL